MKILQRIAFPLAVVVVVFSFTGCSSLDLSNREKGALGGAAVGAGLGAIIGSATGHAGVGTAIGGGLGALSGAIVGNEIDKDVARTADYDARLQENDRVMAENRRLLDELRRQGQDVRLTERGVVVNIPDVLFAFNRYDLSPEAQYTIREVAQSVQSTVVGSERRISVEGHTDSVGTMSYNQELSVKRARSVARALEAEGISRSRMMVRGFGEGDPIASNATEAGRARNRRVEVIVEN